MEPKTKVMYVDDEALNRLVFTKLLAIEAFDVLIAKDGMEALDLLDAHPDVKLIFSDLQMPFMDGIEFIKKAREKYPQKAYALLTCMEKTTIIQQALDSKQIFTYLRKPLNIVELKNVINEMLKLESVEE